jgi:hypothetical protein
MMCVLCGSPWARIRSGLPLAQCSECYATVYWRTRQRARHPELPIALPPEIEYGAKDALLRAHRQITA